MNTRLASLFFRSSCFCCALFLGLLGLLLPVQVSAYAPKAQSKPIPSSPSSGATLSFTFSNLPRAATNIKVSVDLYGDYNSSSENADVTIDGQLMTRVRCGFRVSASHCGGAGECNTSVSSTSKNHKVFTVSKTRANDGTITVVVKNSRGVDYSRCRNRSGSNKVVVSISYGTADFRVEALSVNSTAPRGGPQTVRYRICNRGDSTATAATRIYYSTNSTWGAGDTTLSTLTARTIAANSCYPSSTGTATQTVTIPTVATHNATRYIIAYTDYNNAVNETNETINCSGSTLCNTKFASFRVLRPDLTVSAASVTPIGTVAVGSKVTVKYTLRNRASQFTTDFRVRFYYCPTNNSTTGCVSLGTQSLTNNFNYNQSISFTSPSLTLPRQLSSGTRYIRVFADDAGAITEESESTASNNRWASFSARPDLDVPSVRVSTSGTIGSGSTVRVSYSIRNRYVPFTTNFKVQFFYCTARNTTSCTSIQTVSFSRDFKIETYATFGLRKLPANVVPGTGYIRVFVDSAFNINETTGANNNNWGSFTVNGKPDLQVDTVLLSSTSAARGGPITVHYRVCNKGKTRTSTYFYLRFYYSIDKSWTTGDTYLGRQIKVNGLDAGKCIPSATGVSSTSVTIPTAASYNSTRHIIVYADPPTSRIPEISDAINCSLSSKCNTRYVPFRVRRPDLAVTSATVNTSGTIRAGSNVTVTYKLKNLASQFTTNFRVRFYLCPTNNSTTGCLSLATQSLSSNFAYNQERTFISPSLKMPTSITSGTNYIRVFANDAQNFTEESTSNNNRWAPFNVNGRPDLTVNSVTVTTPAGTVGSGTSVTVRYTIKNNFVRVTTNFKVQFFYCSGRNTSSCTSITTLDNATNLNAGQTAAFQGKRALPSSVLSGTGYIRVFVDSTNLVKNEVSETNNNNWGAFSVNGKPELQVDALTLSPASQVRGGTLTARYRICNKGRARTSTVFYTRFYYSINSIWTTGDTYLNRQITMPALNAGQCTPSATGSSSTTVVVPAVAGLNSTRYIFAYVDPPISRVPEVSESINCALTSRCNTRYASFRVSLAGRDLQVSFLKATSSSGIPGAKTTLSYRLFNAGTLTATNFKTRLYLSKDRVFSPGDTYLAVERVTASLGAGASLPSATTNYSATVTIPTSTALGAYYILAVVDWDKKVAEINENNNTNSVPYTVNKEKKPDLIAFSVKPQVVKALAGTSIKIDYEVRNGGTADVSGYAVRMYYSADTKVDSGDSVLTSFTRAKLIATGKHTGTRTVTVPTTAAAKGYILMFVDPANSIKNEVSENNNVSSSAFQVLVDKDKDGVPNDVDCNDNDKTMYPAYKGKAAATEVCDGKDNNCDKTKDNQPGSTKPLERNCTSTCGTGKETCQAGTYKGCTAPATCEPGVEPKPEVVTEPTPEVTTEPTVDAGTTDTQPGEQPAPDTTGNCYTQSCPANQICVQGTCVADPCQGVNCPTGEFCRSGQCVKACDCLKCPTNETCVDGQCQSNPCAGSQCSGGQICDANTGNCINNPCATVKCGVKRVCVAGKCVDDPCNNIKCLSGQSCRNGQCYGTSCPGQEQTAETTTEPTAETTTEPTAETTTEPTTEPTADAGVSDASDAGATDTNTTDTTASDDPAKADETTTDTPGSTDTTSTTEAITTDQVGTADKGSGNDSSKTGDVIGPPEGGCNCSVNGKPLPLFLMLALLGLLVLTRRRRKA